MNGAPATGDDCESYAEEIGSPSFPVFADGTRQIANATPLTQNTHPEVCALTPDLEIISCYSGHNKYQVALNDIKVHAGL